MQPNLVPTVLAMSQTQSATAAERVPDKRRESRKPAEGSVTIAEERYVLVDWSSSGFLAKNYSDGLSKGERQPIEFSVLIDDEIFCFECSAIIVRTAPEEGLVAGAFVLMDEKDRVAVAQHFA